MRVDSDVVKFPHWPIEHDRSNSDRALRVASLVEAYQRHYDDAEGWGTVLVDLIADLGHYWHERNDECEDPDYGSFDDVTAMACHHLDEERAGR